MAHASATSNVWSSWPLSAQTRESQQCQLLQQHKLLCQWGPCTTDQKGWCLLLCTWKGFRDEAYVGCVSDVNTRLSNNAQDHLCIADATRHDHGRFLSFRWELHTTCPGLFSCNYEQRYSSLKTEQNSHDENSDQHWMDKDVKAAGENQASFEHVKSVPCESVRMVTKWTQLGEKIIWNDIEYPRSTFLTLGEMDDNHVWEFIGSSWGSGRFLTLECSKEISRLSDKPSGGYTKESQRPSVEC